VIGIKRKNAQTPERRGNNFIVYFAESLRTRLILTQFCTSSSLIVAVFSKRVYDLKMSNGCRRSAHSAAWQSRDSLGRPSPDGGNAAFIVLAAGLGLV
jgi:hypothetical protein